MNLFADLLNKGVDFALAREERRDSERLPQSTPTPNEQVVAGIPPSPIIEGERMVGSQSKASSYIKPIAIALGVAIVSGLVVAGIKSALKGAK